MKSFTDLEAWKKGLALAKEIYRITKDFPKEEQYGLTSQLRKAATSILANLAEGFSRSSAPDKAHKYTISRGECAEVHALLLVSMELNILTAEKSALALPLCLETGKLLSGLVQKYSSTP